MRSKISDSMKNVGADVGADGRGDILFCVSGVPKRQARLCTIRTDASEPRFSDTEYLTLKTPSISHPIRIALAEPTARGKRAWARGVAPRLYYSPLKAASLEDFSSSS